eukprot:CAMPEP_0171092638 /NCGR_PEP_ID=MMETSP0766_2-20121228/36663_1 /TAXON_ID=439317 /ORGANISM="Gambierdiscus australes, Strain CAWD 149" /LENGTH=109 /DNA_ID=CAMNT_0011550919 /DNA_START=87 /DNA_END=414 /DNA_ORIENTATION=+
MGLSAVRALAFLSVLLGMALAEAQVPNPVVEGESCEAREATAGTLGSNMLQMDSNLAKAVQEDKAAGGGGEGRDASRPVTARRCRALLATALAGPPRGEDQRTFCLAWW